MKKVRLLLADDHELIRAGLRQLLEREKDFEVVAEASDGREAVALAAKTKPDIAVLDVNMPEVDGLEATRLLRALDNPPQVLILSVAESEEMVRRILEAGARGYVLKGNSTEQVIAGV